MNTNLNSDAFFIRGPHHPCQDYAIAARLDLDDRQLACAVLADGCSSSPHSDVGARILSFAMLKAFRTRSFWKNEAHSCSFDAAELQTTVVAAADEARRTIGIPLQCLDATLMGLACDGERLCVVAWGDGVICLPDGVVELECTSGAPFYLSYLLNDERRSQYSIEFDGDLLVRTDGGVKKRPADSSPSYFSVLDVDVPEFTATVFSDGAAAFRDEESEPVPTAEIVAELTGFKNFRGRYVERRMRKGLKTLERAGQRPFDDLSCASLRIERELRPDEECCDIPLSAFASTQGTTDL